MNELNPEDVNGNVLYLAHRMQSQKDRLFKIANKETKENGTGYEYFKYGSQNKTVFDKGISNWLADESVDAKAIADISSVTKSKYEEKVSPELQQKAINIGLVYQGKAAPSLKRK